MKTIKIILSQQLMVVMFSFILGTNLYAQNVKMVDRVVAIVGDKIVMQSDIENQVLQYNAQGYFGKSDLKCEVLEELLVQKLLLNQAELDSIEVSENKVQEEIDRRIMFFVRQVGSEEKLVEYYNKSIPEIKEDFRDLIREQLRTQSMQRNIVTGIKVSPKEVAKFYKSLPEDSIPMINSEYEVNQLVLYPPNSDDARLEAREKLLGLRERIMNGERFSTLAVLYSEDPGTARKGGELGFRAKQELDPEFSKVAWSLKVGQVSRIVESEHGFHIIELIAREGEQVNVRHILIKTKVQIEQRIALAEKLDSITNLIRLDSLTFEEAAFRFSEDQRSRLHNGLMINPMTASTKYALDEFSREDYYMIKDLKLGQISEPFEALDEEGKTVFKIIRVKSKVDAHRADLSIDYTMIEEMTITSKQGQVFQNWIDEKQKVTYIHLDESFRNCKFTDIGWIK